MERFKALEFESHPVGAGIRAKMYFPNGYGASVVKGWFSYGGDEGKYELAVTDSDGRVVYDTSITDDVLGYLSEEEVDSVLGQIMDLPNREVTDENNR